MKELLQLIFYLNYSQKVKKELETIRDEELVDYLYKTSKIYLAENKINDTLIKKPKNLIDTNKNIYIEDRPKDKVEEATLCVMRTGLRSEAEKNKAIEISNCKCEVDELHNFFISRKTNKNYVEGHHLIPLEFQDDFSYSLDVGANMVSLCVVCHKKLHYAIFEEKKEIIDKLYDKRKDRLKACGIPISIDKLYKYYKKDIEEH